MVWLKGVESFGLVWRHGAEEAAGRLYALIASRSGLLPIMFITRVRL